jgi:hypothetical protein
LCRRQSLGDSRFRGVTALANTDASKQNIKYANRLFFTNTEIHSNTSRFYMSSEASCGVRMCGDNLDGKNLLANA